MPSCAGSKGNGEKPAKATEMWITWCPEDLEPGITWLAFNKLDLMQRGNNPGCAGPRMLDRSGLNLPCRPLFSWDYEPRIWFYMLSVIYDTGVFLAGKGPNPCTANIHEGLKRFSAAGDGPLAKLWLIPSCRSHNGGAFPWVWLYRSTKVSRMYRGRTDG